MTPRLAPRALRLASAPALALTLALGACSLVPERPITQAGVAAGYPAAADTGRVVEDLALPEFLPDPRLQALVTRALENNRDLRQAALRIEEARATYRIQVAEQLPVLGATAQAGRSQIFSPLIPGGAVFRTTQYQVGLGVTAFELDFFGRVRSLSESALAQFLATDEARQAAALSLVAQVARTHLAERALAEQQALAARSLATREASLRVTRQRFDAGINTGMDLRQAESLVEDARTALAALDRQRAQAANALAQLTGAPLAGLPEPLPLVAQLPVQDLAPGLPSTLLARRPDLRAAERRLEAANASIGAARAAFFPRIALTGTFGRTSTELDGLFGGRGFNIWSFLPQLSLPIFDAGRNRANLSLAEVRRDLGVAAYEGSVQTAFREVADALVAREAYVRELESARAKRDAEAARLALFQQRRDAGVIDELAWLDAQRQSFAAEQALVQTLLARSTNLVDLYAALGGGPGAGRPD